MEEKYDYTFIVEEPRPGFDGAPKGLKHKNPTKLAQQLERIKATVKKGTWVKFTEVMASNAQTTVLGYRYPEFQFTTRNIVPGSKRPVYLYCRYVGK
jgi:hypothetical protein